MCTLSWKHSEDGYLLLFNRDELRTRSPAEPPSLHHTNGVNFLAPIDVDRGGTWLLINEFGIAICLLNHYPKCSSSGGTISASRGHLVMACADCRTLQDVTRRITALPGWNYPAFRLVAMDSRCAVQFLWDGQALISCILPGEGGMLTSSSVRTEFIESMRQNLFHDIVGHIGTASAERLMRFHRHTMSDSAIGVLMSRPDACTHNLIQITLSRRYNSAWLRYEDFISPDTSNDIIETDLALSPDLSSQQGVTHEMAKLS